MLRVLIIVASFCPAVSAFAHDVIVTRNSNLRTEPNSSSAIIKLLEPSDEAKLLEIEKVGGYYHVSRH